MHLHAAAELPRGNMLARDTAALFNAACRYSLGRGAQKKQKRRTRTNY
jgi:hypothetical protein